MTAPQIEFEFPSGDYYPAGAMTGQSVLAADGGVVELRSGSRPAGLRVPEDLVLPEDLVTQTVAILGKRESGKTSTGVVFVEELYAARLPFVVLDPLDVWWGLRSSADGAGQGLPVLVIGGAAIADFLIEQRVPTMLSLRALRKNASRRFVTDLGERLFERTPPGRARSAS